MPTKQLRFPGLIANSAGEVSGSHDETPPLNVSLERVVVKSTSGCESRNHDLRAGFSGGASFDYSGIMSDCSDLEIDLGSISSPAFSTTTMSFKLAGYRPSEAVDLEGTLYYSIALFEFERLLSRIKDLEQRVAALEPKP